MPQTPIETPFPIPTDESESARLRSLLSTIYGDDARLAPMLDELFADIARAARERPSRLRAVDAEHERNPLWYESNTALAGVCYVDRYAGNLKKLLDHIPYFRELGLTYLHLMPLFDAPPENSDGGYAVSSYRRVAKRFGTMDDLRNVATQLRDNGIALAVDFVFNHTSNEHEWARKAAEGDPYYEDFYWIYRDRTMPDAFERTTREIFPENHPGSFVPLSDGRWVWATFHTFQWDLNYSNPNVFRAMANEMLFLANQGVGVLRMDAVAFIWKKLGTSSENLPEAHLLLQAFNAVLRLVAPGTVFLSEAIVHPDDVVEYMGRGECQLSYNPLQMALIWSTLATRDVGLLSQALETRHETPPGTAWVNYVRSHDDIGWTFADEDAALLGIDGEAHRRFLNRYFVGEFPGSFARGIPFQFNEKTGDARVSGTTASLAGLESGDEGAVRRILLAHSIVLSTGGLPLIYLGDEVGQLNDYGYLERSGERDDSRWSGRPWFPASLYAQRNAPGTRAAALYSGFRRLIEARAATPEFSGTELVPFDTRHSQVLGYQRPGDGSYGSHPVVVLANVGDGDSVVNAVTLSGLPASMTDLVTGRRVAVHGGLTLGPQQFVWLR